MYKLLLLPYLAVICLVLNVSKVSCQKNVLMIVVDDLRPEIGEFKNTEKGMNKDIKTPAIDALAEQSMKFKNAYSQYTTCAPSRASFLTGRRPDTSGVVSKAIPFRTKMPDVVTLPQHFKNEGYLTYGIGKIFHTGDDDVDTSWTEVIQPNNEAYWHKNVFKDESWGAADTTSTNRQLPDNEVLSDAKRKLNNVGKNNFFLAVGFKRPHLPLVCPQEYFDYYPESDISLPKYPDVPTDYPDIAWNEWLDLMNYEDIKGSDSSYGKGLLDEKTKKLRRAYYACVSYVDDLIKQLLQHLDDNGLTDNTVVLFMSDHGYHLGEHSQWTKGTLLQLDTHVPMLLKVPGVTDNGMTTDAIVENIDIFATLAEAAGISEVPQCPDDTVANQPNLCHEGMSAYRFLQDPDAKSKDWALTQYSRQGDDGNTYMGYSIRNTNYHYVRWVNYNSGSPDWDADIAGEELYDHKKGDYVTLRGKTYLIKKNSNWDPYETVNRAGKSKYDSKVQSLYSKLKKSYTAAMPGDAF